MRCARCLNEDPHYFYLGSKGYYCRKCVQYGRVLFNQEPQEYYYQPFDKDDVDYQLTFKLTSLQKEISEKCAALCLNENVLIYAACGCGKTEIVMESIKQALNKGLRVGYAIPRRQVVLEIGDRLRKAFDNLKIVTVCEGYTKETEGDLIICTTHQLYRYYNYFDLLILDEPDAFPYKGNSVLQGIAQTSCKGHMIALSATPDEKLKRYKTLTLFKRPHNHPLTVPQVYIYPQYLMYIKLVNYLRENDHVLIFVPTIEIAKRLGQRLRASYFTSQTENKEELVNRFRDKKIKHLVCTTVLERGVTFSNVKVVIYYADHVIFDKASLIQIAGRTGRDPNYPDGEVLFLCLRKSKTVKQCLKDIKQMNA